MVVGEASINNIMGGIESTGGVRLHNHKRKLKQRFDIIKKLGQGTYGKVQLGINKETGQEVAIKTIKKCKIETEADLIRIRREIQIMSSVQHPNIIHIYEVFENREKMVLVMEYAAGGELYDYLSERKVLTEEEARRIFRQIATAVYYCHKHKICHRDLKLENILLDEFGNAKIADFGLSNVFDGQRLLSTFCGSPLYASPEIVKGTPYLGPEVDCWSLGVLLYTLVYGAMPFDGSNFKRLVKQISQGEYFEPKKPSPASSLIRDMLTVNPTARADMERICSHWWVNEGHSESCLTVAEHLASLTPVRLDLLLSLAPPLPRVGSNKLLVADGGEGADVPEPEPDSNAVTHPVRSLSAGDIVERVSPAQRNVRDLVADTALSEALENKQSPKRKLEVTMSMENATQAGAKRKERSRKKDRDSSAERRSSHRSNSRNKYEAGAPPQDASMNEIGSESNEIPTDVPSQLSDKNMDVEQTNEQIEQLETAEQTEGAMCAELVEENDRKAAAAAATVKDKRKSIKLKKPKSDLVTNKIIEETENDIPKRNDTENKENINILEENVTNEDKTEVIKEDTVPKKSDDDKNIVKKKVLAENNQVTETPVVEAKVESSVEVAQENIENKVEECKVEDTKPTEEIQETNTEQKVDIAPKSEAAQGPTKPIERRRSKIFETAEKFQNMGTTENKTPVPDKPKKIFIPGVNVGGFKQAFERKASITSTTPPKSTVKKLNDTRSKSVDLPSETKKLIPNGDVVNKAAEEIQQPIVKEEPKIPESVNNVVPSDGIEPIEEDEERKKKVKNAVSIISKAIDNGARKSKSRPNVIRKPPMFGIGGRSASGGIAHIVSPTEDGNKVLKVQVAPGDVRTANIHVSTPEHTKYPSDPFTEATVNLRSATLPRRKTSKAEITLNYPPPKPAVMEFKTEMQHRIDSTPKLKTQRSEVSFPVSGVPKIGFRSTSLEPETVKPKERIIPIAFENEPVRQIPAASKPPRPVQSQSVSSQPQRATSMSRQSTQESDTESLASAQPEPIRKSPREYIIPIAVEGGGYVTPRAGSLEPSEAGSKSSRVGSTSRFGRPVRRMNSLLSDKDGSEDESPFVNLHRHNSIGRDSDTEDSHREGFHLNRLRSSRPFRKAPLEHADSLSSGEEDDDDGFELLTAENLFSTLLSRVRSLTQRLNVDDGDRPGFPNSRLLSNFARDNFWNFHNRPDPLSRHTPLGRTLSRESDTAPWRRSVTRDLASDIDKVFGGDTHTLPRGKHNKEANLDLTDLNLAGLKLTDEDTVALSYLTPGLSRRIQKQLLAQLPPAQAKKLSRTLSMQGSRDKSSIRLTTRSGSESEVKSVDNDKKSDAHSYTSLDSVNTEKKENNSNNNDNNVSMSSLQTQSIDFDERSFKSQSRERFSPLSDDLSFKSDCVEYRTNPSKVYNSDLSESDRQLLENYRKSRENRRTLRSVSVLESSRDSASYKPPLPNRSISVRSEPLCETLSPDRSVLGKYLTPYADYSWKSKHGGDISDENKTQTLGRRSSTRKVSRFLRPDFYETPAEESIFVKEKKERELETQKVLKEIRDKRFRKRLGVRDLSADGRISSYEKNPEVDLSWKEVTKDKFVQQEQQDKIDVAATKSKIAKLIRPKSFPEKDVNKEVPKEKNLVKDSPNELNSKKEVLKDLKCAKEVSKDLSYTKEVSNVQNVTKEPSPELKVSESIKKSPEKEISRMNKLRKSFSSQKNKVSEDVDNTSEKVPTNKNKFLQSLEKGFEKLRTFSNSSDDSEKSSRVSCAIRRLREQSLPRITENITESGLIKRAVSVEDLSTMNSIGDANAKMSRKSVSKILGLFKKYENKENGKSKKNEKTVKDKKESDNQSKKEKKVVRKTKEVDESADNKKNELNDTVKTKTVKKSKLPSKLKKKETKNTAEPEISETLNNAEPKQNMTLNCNNIEPVTAQENSENSDTKKSKSVRPKSLLFDRIKCYNGAKTDSILSIPNGDVKCKIPSKLPVNIKRRSLDIENESVPKTNNMNNEITPLENGVMNGNDNSDSEVAVVENHRKALKLDFSNIQNAQFETKSNKELNCNSEKMNNIDNNAAINSNDKKDCNENETMDLPKGQDYLTSPCDESELNFDNWSVYSDNGSENRMHEFNITSPSLLSGDENESLIDRIRRKSFYSRFNEKKQRRKSTLVGPGANYNDFELPRPTSKSYKSSKESSSNYRPDSLDCCDNLTLKKYKKPLDYESKRYSYLREPSFNKSSIPVTYHTYNPKFNKYPSYVSSDLNDLPQISCNYTTSGAEDDVGCSGIPTRYNSHGVSSSNSLLNNLNIQKVPISRMPTSK